MESRRAMLALHGAKPRAHARIAGRLLRRKIAGEGARATRVVNG